MSQWFNFRSNNQDNNDDDNDEENPGTTTPTVTSTSQPGREFEEIEGTNTEVFQERLQRAQQEARQAWVNYFGLTLDAFAQRLAECNEDYPFGFPLRARATQEEINEFMIP